ncbi:MAG TPA: chloride channel protein [Gemmatimonadales bacterium]|jgi:H+/Cl- antiporter ClcA
MSRERGLELGDFTANRRLLTLIPMAAVVGTMAAFVAAALVKLIDLVTNLAYFHRVALVPASPADHRLGIAAVLVPMIGGLIIGLMARFGSDRIRGHGIPEAMEAILIGRSRMDAKVAILKPLSSAISIGTGGPFGAEGPIIMTGGAFGSLFAQAFHLTAAERKTLLVAGAAAGMAAIFAAPLASVLLAVELLLFEWKPRSFIPVAAAAAMAAALRVPLLGPGPIFPVEVHPTLPWQELGLALPIGIVAGLGSGALTRLVYTAEDLFARLPLDQMWWPVIGGAVVGLGGLLYPHALGVGYDVVADLLRGNIVGTFLLGFLLTKAVIWAVALGSGTSGGVLAPLLIIGGSLGAATAQWLRPEEAGLWAMTSMAAMMGGTMRSPLTSVAFLLELTGDIGVLPALLIASAAAHGVTVLLMRRSILTEKVARRGHHVAREYIVNPLSRVWVDDVMEREVPALASGDLVTDVLRRLADGDPTVGHRHAWPVLDGGTSLDGLVTRGDLVRALGALGPAVTVGQAASRPLIVAPPDELLADAVDRMVRHGVGRLLVVDPRQPDRLLGYLGRTGIADALGELLDEEEIREVGWITARARLLRRQVRQLLRPRGSA